MSLTDTSPTQAADSQPTIDRQHSIEVRYRQSAVRRSTVGRQSPDGFFGGAVLHFFLKSVQYSWRGEER